MTVSFIMMKKTEEVTIDREIMRIGQWSGRNEQELITVG